jgi:PadR family transcriptional regulator, regulatory protein PadR
MDHRGKLQGWTRFEHPEKPNDVFPTEGRLVIVPYLGFYMGDHVGRRFSLTYPTAAVLLAIQNGHRYGFDIMDATGLPDGTVYPILRRLERRGVLAGAWEDEVAAKAEQRPQRRYYALTPVGAESLAEVEERFPALPRLFDAEAGRA